MRPGEPRMPKDMGTQNDPLISEICWHYYINEMTQSEIAKMLGLTRLRVNQSIQQAKAMGMVKVQVESPFVTRLEQQEELRQALGVEKVLVVPANRENYDYHASVGAGLANYLGSELKAGKWKRIGVSWGASLQSAIEHLPRHSMPDTEVLALMGGTVIGASFNAFSVASGFAEKLDASYSLLVAPIYLPDGVDRATFLAQDIYQSHLKKCLKADAALLVVGDITEQSYIVKYGLPKDITPANLRKAGAVGDLLGRYLDKDGNEIDHPINNRTAGVELKELAKIPNKILIAAGKHKVPIIRAVAKRGDIDTLITDDVTAECLLSK